MVEAKLVYDEAKCLAAECTVENEPVLAFYGKHCVWIPERGMKIIWSHNGKIEALRDWNKGRNKEALLNGTFNDSTFGWEEESYRSILDEYFLMKRMADLDMAPTVGSLFYIKNMISDNIYGALHCDPLGRYGYYVKPAQYLEEGKFSVGRFNKEFVDTNKVKASVGALGDLEKESNIINGYLIDVRRTIWDMIQLNYTDEMYKSLWDKHRYREDKEKIKEKVKKMGQFPYGSRKQHYQSYWLGDEYVGGSRDTLYRFNKMGIPEDMKGQTVLDLGCCIGSICSEVYRRGARKVMGLDNQREFIDCARDIARYNGHQINYLQSDLSSADSVVEFVRKYYGPSLTTVFCLSLFKHIQERLWYILNNIPWNVCYIESHNAPEGLKTGHVIEMQQAMENYFGKINVTCLGLTEDRSPRVIWKVVRK